jgi:hypothetical protein
MSTPKPECPRCGGDGVDPRMTDPDFKPTYEALINNDPLPCSQCHGTGVEDPYESVEDWRYDR